MTIESACPTCRSADPNVARSDCYNPWHLGQELLAARVVDPADPTTPDYLSDDELAGWIDRAALKRPALIGTYLRLVLDELRERRDAEAIFVDADLQLQRITDCASCADDTHDTGDEHRAILKRWRIARAALCALARIHRGYLIPADLPNGDIPR